LCKSASSSTAPNSSTPAPAPAPASSLPKGKTAVQVFGDYLRYLFKCTKDFIINTHAGGGALWRALEGDLQFVLSHPNGWEGAQQTKMCGAAVYGALIPDTDADSICHRRRSQPACLRSEWPGYRDAYRTSLPLCSSVYANDPISGSIWTRISCRRRRRRDTRYQFVCRTWNLAARYGRDRPPDCLLLLGSHLVLHSSWLFQASSADPFLLVEELVHSLKVC
jgi:hypothetical protein